VTFEIRETLNILRNEITREQVFLSFSLTLKICIWLNTFFIFVEMKKTYLLDLVERKVFKYFIKFLKIHFVLSECEHITVFFILGIFILGIPNRDNKTEISIISQLIIQFFFVIRVASICLN